MNDGTSPDNSYQRQWRHRASCHQIAPYAMFPDAGDQDGIDYAKSICAQCPVRPECLGEAVDRGERFGIWGGLTPEELRLLRRRKRRSDGTADLPLPE